MEEIQHFSHKKHPLIFVEDLQNDGENEVVCSGCDKSVCGPAYKCSDCNFFLHKSCAELPTEIQHPVHPNHTLVLDAPSKIRFCDACLKCCERCFAYECRSCNFDLDIECASGWQTKPDDCHQHEFVPIMKHIPFTCEVCGEDRNSGAQICRICQLFTHAICAQRPRSIRIMADRHLLTLIYSLAKVIKEHEDDHVFCQLCYKKLSLKYAGYYCQQCDFVAHLKCAQRNRNIGASSDTIEGEEEGIEFEEGEEREELKHLDHEHNLILTRNQLEVHHNKLCEGCIQPIITAPFYSCEQCNYFLHSACARLPLKKRLPSHRHLLTLYARGDHCINGIFPCIACKRFSNGFVYGCQECDGYYCLDIRCCSIPKMIKNEGHQHSLFHAISSLEDCNACDSRCHPNGVFVCKECDFALGFECATLPLKVKYEHDPHLLSLTYTAENDSEEYYCLICEEERNPNHWFYYCVECNFAAHIRYVIGNYPYIKYGINFTRKDHQHPLNFVWKTKNSRPCDVCHETFKGDMALNCTQCKFVIHLQPRCMGKLHFDPWTKSEMYYMHHWSLLC
ncbi:uncharacterized protein LOC132164468 [Corylus avellana]|uniref:uncharacterized protein LOC132164468 n=1 Tax=Corylus avellana TaxID=13451 RepID=UPI00286A207A|nr:uncharacterized protein LOC132164468 [Corylus avellana]